MNAQMRALLREGILMVLQTSGEFRPTRQVVRISLNGTGIEATDEEVGQELDYLIDKGFAVKEGRSISPELTRYRITAAGRDYLATEGLA